MEDKAELLQRDHSGELSRSLLSAPVCACAGRIKNIRNTFPAAANNAIANADDAGLHRRAPCERND
jgi:hypothetical protein